jgi:phytoene synthase
MPAHSPTFAEDIAACRAALCTGSRSFYAASKLLPRNIRDSATALYAFCREADDAIDLGTNPNAALATLRARLTAAYAGSPWNTATDRAFAATVATHRIPETIPAALIEGMEWDVETRRYETIEDLLDYAARVAGTVGIMMSLIMGVRDAPTLARAADLGIAMQLSNIARDVGEDARAGRLFLPLAWLREAGIDPENFLISPEFSRPLAAVIQKLLTTAETFYKSAHAGILCLPLPCQPGIAAARRIYAAIGRKLAATGYDSITTRTRVTGREKIRHAAAALRDLTAFWLVPSPAAAAATQFLVTAAAETPPVQGYAKLLVIFERLERTQRDPGRQLAA